MPPKLYDPRPRLVTYQELWRVLGPLVEPYPWGRAALHDLWKMGAPTGRDDQGREVRILIPTHFKTWWDDVQQKMGFETVDANVALGMVPGRRGMEIK